MIKLRLYVQPDLPLPVVVGKLPIWGVVYIQLGEISFPDKEWDDAVSSILVMWSEEVSQFIASQYKNKCDLYFMDGPFKIQLFMNTSGNIVASFVGNNKVLVSEAEIQITDLVTQLQNASKELIEVLKDQKNSYIFNSVRSSYLELNHIASKHLHIDPYHPNN